MNNISYGRKDRLVKEREHDVYRFRAKLPDPTVCAECGAVFMKGRWVWTEAPEQAGRSICSACRRIADRFPAGHIEMAGDFFVEHRDEILNLVRNIEQREKTNHPMERIIDIGDMSKGALITTTGIHLARRIGSALARAYSGELKVNYLNAESCVKVRWVR